MIRQFTCAHCEDGKLWTSRYGGNDPDVWCAGQCEECDGQGNDEIDDEGVILNDFVLEHNERWYMHAEPVPEYRALSDGCVGQGSSEGAAVRSLIDNLLDQKDEREYERQCAVAS